MQIELEGRAVDLSYCTNIHAARGLDAVLASLARHAPALKARLCPERPFGLGLRLSDAEATELVDGGRLPELTDLLDAHDLYVPGINGFPFGAFHGVRVKDRVHAPDWRSGARAAYTLRLATLLASLRAEGQEGGVSTNPLTYRAWVDARDPAMWETMVAALVVVVEGLVHLRRDTGRLIHLDLEPEPDGLIETSGEFVDFFEDELLHRGAPVLARGLGLGRDAAEGLLRDHVRVCLDACHAAVLHEDADALVDRLQRHDVRIGRVQISSALRVDLPGDPEQRRRVARRLEALADGVYLHQVVSICDDGSVARFADLPDALGSIEDPRHREWRIHLHVPIFQRSFDDLGTTQPDLDRLLRRMRARPFTAHLEIETYTWGVLPEDLRLDLTDSIEREYEWVRHVLD